VALLPIGLFTIISLTKSGSGHPSVKESPIRLWALASQKFILQLAVGTKFFHHAIANPCTM
jgi:hypothetical protein